MIVDEEQRDALREVLNLGFGRAAATLNEMLKAHVSLTVPQVEFLSPSEFVAQHPDPQPLSVVRMPIHGAFVGNVGLAFSLESAVNLVSALTGEEAGSDRLASMQAGALSEVGNIVINRVMGAIGNFLKCRFQFGLPTHVECSLGRLVEDCAPDHEGSIMVGRTRFDVTALQLVGEMLMVFDVEPFRERIEALQFSGVTSG